MCYNYLFVFGGNRSQKSHCFPQATVRFTNNSFPPSSRGSGLEGQAMSAHQFVVGTRFFESNRENAATSFSNLIAFITAALSVGAEKVFVAVNSAIDTSGALTVVGGLGFEQSRVKVFAVTPWGKFVQPLNALLIHGREEFARGVHFLSASVEVKLTPAIVNALFQHMDNTTLVVGAAMEGHDYHPGAIEMGANGRQVPWNTLALWNAERLCRTGFPLIGDGPLGEPKSAGVEEVTAIALQQAMLHGSDKAIAKLVRVPGIVWDMSGFGGVRRAAHEAKMESKVRRPAAQLVAARLSPPVVHHI